MDNQVLKMMYEQKKLERSNIQEVWNLIENYVVPFRAKFYTSGADSNNMSWRRRTIYDSTAVDANQVLGAHLQSSMANPAYRWFDVVLRNRNSTENNEESQWMTMASEITFFILLQSNFDLINSEAFIDIPSFGQAMIGQEFKEVDNKFRKLLFSSIPMDQGYYELDDEDKPSHFWRSLNWTPNQFFLKFGKDVKLPEKVAAKLAAFKNDETFELVYSIFPRYDYIDADVRKKLAPETRPYGFKYFMADSAEQVGEEGGYYEMPIYIPMWRKTSRSQFGHSPAMVVLSDILSLNQLVEMILKAGEKAIDPPVGTTRRGVYGDVDLRPGGVTVVQSKDSMWHMESRARFDVGKLEKSDLQDSIRRAFFADKLELKQSPEMTAAEVYTRFELMSRMIGPSAGRIQNGFHAPAVITTFNGLFRAGVFSDPPESIRDAEMDVEFIGPMARAQKLDKVNNIERYTQNLGAMSELFEDILDNINSDGLANEMAAHLTIPPSILNNKAKRNTIRQKRAKEKEELMLLEKAQMAASAAKDAGPMIQGGGDNGQGLAAPQ